MIRPFKAFCAVALFAAGSYVIPAHAQSIDTISVAKIQPGDALRDVVVRVDEKIDTMIWGGKEGASILKFTKPYYGFPGEFRIATDGPYVSQLTFTTTFKSAEETKKAFEKLSDIFTKAYGPSTDQYKNVYNQIKWRGAKQSIAIQNQDGNNYVSVVLAQMPKHATVSTPATTAAPSTQSADVPLRKRAKKPATGSK